MPFQSSFRIIKLSALSLFTLLWLFACRNEPAHLPMEKMSQILTEMYIAESYVQYLPKDTVTGKVRNQEDSLKKFVAAVFAENKTDEAVFKKSIDWYKSRPELLDSIYQQVLSDLSIWQAKIDQK